MLSVRRLLQNLTTRVPKPAVHDAQHARDPQPTALHADTLDAQASVPQGSSTTNAHHLALTAPASSQRVAAAVADDGSPDAEQIAQLLSAWVVRHGVSGDARALHLIAHSLYAVALHDDMQRFFAGKIDIDALQGRTAQTIDALKHVMNDVHGLQWSAPALPSFEEAFLIDDERLFAEARQQPQPSVWKAIAIRTAGMAMGAPFGFYAMILGGHAAGHLHRKLTHEPQSFRSTAFRLAGLGAGATLGGPGAMLAAQALAGELEQKVGQLKEPLAALKAKADALFKAMLPTTLEREGSAAGVASQDDESDWVVVESP